MSTKLTITQTRPHSLQWWYWECFASVNDLVFMRTRELLSEYQIPKEIIENEETRLTTVYIFESDEFFKELWNSWSLDSNEKTERQRWEEEVGITTSFTIEEIYKDR